MNRRGFLTRATIGVVVGMSGVSCADPARGAAGDDIARETPPLAAALGIDAVHRLGRIYILQTKAIQQTKTRPREQTADALRAMIGESRADARRWWWSDTPTLTAVIVADFAAGRTVLVDGWMLSLTEARHCALVALVAG